MDWVVLAFAAAATPLLIFLAPFWFFFEPPALAPTCPGPISNAAWPPNSFTRS